MTPVSALTSTRYRAPYFRRGPLGAQASRTASLVGKASRLTLRNLDRRPGEGFDALGLDDYVSFGGKPWIASAQWIDCSRKFATASRGALAVQSPQFTVLLSLQELLDIFSRLHCGR